MRGVKGSGTEKGIFHWRGREMHQAIAFASLACLKNCSMSSEGKIRVIKSGARTPRVRNYRSEMAHRKQYSACNTQFSTHPFLKFRIERFSPMRPCPYHFCTSQRIPYLSYPKASDDRLCQRKDDIAINFQLHQDIQIVVLK